MKKIKLSGGQYGGYIVDGGKAFLYENVFEEGKEKVIADEKNCTINNNIINVDGWLYDIKVSLTIDTADFIGMAQ